MTADLGPARAGGATTARAAAPATDAPTTPAPTTPAPTTPGPMVAPPGSPTRARSRPATAAILVTVILWASAFVAIRYVGREVSAGALALGRLMVASLLLGLFLVAQRLWAGWGRAARGAGGVPSERRWPSGKGWALLLTCGVAWFGVYNVALNEAERRLDAGTAAMLISLGPILIALLGATTLREGLSAWLIAGCAVALAGVGVISLPTWSAGWSADGLGVLLCVAAAACWAIGAVAQKPVLGEMSALRVTLLACTAGMVACLPFAPALVHDLRTAGPASIAWVAYLGAFPTAVAFTTWAYALARSTAGRLGATTYLVPPVAVLLGWLLLGERPAGLAFAGGALCLAGVYVARRR